MNSLFLWLIPGVTFWINGYLHSREEVSYHNQSRYLIKPYPIFYFICGLPKAENISEGVMVVQLFCQQIFGLMLIIYGTLFDKYVSATTGNPFLSYAVGIFAPALICGLIILVVARKKMK